MPTEVTAVLFGLAAAASWGAGDFSGGLATRRSGSVLAIVILSQLLGGFLLALLALAFKEPWPQGRDLLWGAAAGLSGAIGLVSLYKGLAVGRMGVVAPVTAVFSAALPVLVSFLLEGLPTPIQFAGFALALAAVWLVSGADSQHPIRRQDLTLPLAAGLGFGGFFIFADQVTMGAVLWPIVVARSASSSFLLLLLLIRRQSQHPPSRQQLPLIALVGLLDTGGNAFFILAAQAGRLDMASVLSSLYPAVTVFLAWLFLQEKLTRQQGMGIVLAVTAVILITA